MTNLNTKSTDVEKVRVQNIWMNGSVGYCAKPTWFMDGCEKKIKIGSTAFNYIDYLEAQHNFDCGTHRNRLTSLIDIKKRIDAAFEEIENHKYK